LKLSDEQISQFQILYKKTFNEELSKEAALSKAIKLCNLINVVRTIKNRKV
jgi:hypothetical protein